DEQLAALSPLEPRAEPQGAADRHRAHEPHGELPGERRLLQHADDEPREVVEDRRDDPAVRPPGSALERRTERDVGDHELALAPRLEGHARWVGAARDRTVLETGAPDGQQTALAAVREPRACGLHERHAIAVRAGVELGGRRARPRAERVEALVR